MLGAAANRGNPCCAAGPWATVAGVSSPTAREPVGPALDEGAVHEPVVDLRADPRPVTVPSQPDRLTHEVRVVDGRFMHAECSCGWRTAGRRDRRKARAEARDHALLYADGGSVADLRDEPRRA